MACMRYDTVTQWRACGIIPSESPAAGVARMHRRKLSERGRVGVTGKRTAQGRQVAAVSYERLGCCELKGLFVLRGRQNTLWDREDTNWDREDTNMHQLGQRLALFVHRTGDAHCIASVAVMSLRVLRISSS
eukprot:Polyplicarium_translucidae@DN4602_c0_g1_i1.p1